ncbi:MAG: hypothetical protein V1779_00670 [bacterium]
MKPRLFILTNLLLVISGCSATLEITEINGLNKATFKPLYIEPDIELYNLRIDIIRQTYDDRINDSISETKEVPYHKLGFDLGNGMFYDLNDNLSLRIDYLLNIDTKGDFKIETSYANKKWNRIYSSQNDGFTIEYTNRKKTYTMFQINRLNDSLSIFYKNKYGYSIVKDDSAMVYMDGKRIIDKVQKKDENYYYQKLKKTIDEYKYVEHDLILDSKYKIAMSQSGDVLEIFRMGKKMDYPQYKIIKNEKMIFIFNDKYHGKKIVMDEGKFTLYHNDVKICDYTRVE